MSATKKTFTSLLYRKKTGAKPRQELLDLRKTQADIQSKIMNSLKDSPKTVPELSKAIGMDAKTVLWYLSTYYKYNLVSVVEKTDGGFYRYAVKQKE
ncbi:MAG: ArsR family transcriptional regulator [Nitrososphaerota archaeon]|jgi:predicted transcriptional regulator|nr:ArsR family transcriptional regulator [Nitrososphaerota archaeon]MDG6922097.1 ArsR family transcriptional regulator [Nitrososphaerota archaeon]